MKIKGYRVNLFSLFLCFMLASCGANNEAGGEIPFRAAWLKAAKRVSHDGRARYSAGG